MPAKLEDDLIWVAADAPLADSGFLSNKIKDLCGDLPIFWLRPTYSTSKSPFRPTGNPQNKEGTSQTASTTPFNVAAQKGNELERKIRVLLKLWSNRGCHF